MRTKLHAKLDQATITMLQRCREVTGLKHNDELIKFMASLTLQSYIEARTRMLNEQQKATDSDLHKPNPGGFSEISGNTTGANQER